MAKRVVRRIGGGRAWGNALGGWRMQPRGPRGRFQSKSGGIRVGSRKTGRTVGGRSPARPASSAKSLAKTLRTTPLKEAKGFTEKDYNRAVKLANTNSYSVKARPKTRKVKVNTRAHIYHSSGIAVQKVGEYGGNLAGMSAGAPLGVFGVAAGGMVGAMAGRAIADRALAESPIAISRGAYMALSPRDRALMAKRERTVETVDFAINLGLSAYQIYRMKVGPLGAADYIRKRKTARVMAQTHGLPRAGAGSKGSFQPKSAGRWGANRGVYDITTGGASLRRVGGSGMSGVRIR